MANTEKLAEIERALDRAVYVAELITAARRLVTMRSKVNTPGVTIQQFDAQINAVHAILDKLQAA